MNDKKHFVVKGDYTFFNNKKVTGWFDALKRTGHIHVDNTDRAEKNDAYKFYGDGYNVKMHDNRYGRPFYISEFYNTTSDDLLNIVEMRNRLVKNMKECQENLQEGVKSETNSLVSEQDLKVFNRLCEKYKFDPDKNNSQDDKVYYFDEQQIQYESALAERDHKIDDSQKIDDEYKQAVQDRKLNLESSFFSYLPLLVANAIVDKIDALIAHMRKNEVIDEAKNAFEQARRAIDKSIKVNEGKAILQTMFEFSKVKNTLNPKNEPASEAQSNTSDSDGGSFKLSCL